MTNETIEIAVAEAERFIAAAKRLEEAEKTNGRGVNPKENGALRRASMDLTRALADMRRPG